MASISLQHLFSYAQSAYFFNRLQNYSYLLYSVGGGLRPGTGFTNDMMNNILAGQFEGETRPQLNVGAGGAQSMPLQLFKDDTMYTKGANLERYLNFFRNEFVEKARGYPEGITAPDSDGQVYLSDGAVTMYPSYPYISVNYYNWLNVTRPKNIDGFSTNPVNEPQGDRGAQFVIFNERVPEQGGLRIENDPLEFQQSIVKDNATKPAQGGGAQLTFTYIPGSNAQSFEIVYENSDTINTEKIQGSSGSWKNTASTSLEIATTNSTQTSVEVPEVGKGGTTISSSLKKAFTAATEYTKAWNESLKNGSSSFNKSSLKQSLSPSNWKEGSKISDIVQPPPGVTLDNPNQVLESGGRYRALFKVTESKLSVPTTGFSKVTGTADAIAPRSMQYQASGKDKGRANWSIDGTKNGGELEGKGADFWGQQFINYAGPLAYNLDTVKIGEKEFDGIKVDKSAGSMSVLNLATSTLKLNYDVIFDIQRISASGDFLQQIPSNALLNLESDYSQSSMAQVAITDLDSSGQINMSDYYEGFEGTDSVDGTEEGDDTVETFGGNDYVSGFKDSYINTGDGQDVVVLSSGYGDNVVATESGADTVELMSSGNNCELGSGADVAFLSTSNTIDLGDDEDLDQIVVIADDFNVLSDGASVLLNYDLGEDLVYGLSGKDLEYRYDPVHQRILGSQSGSTDGADMVNVWMAAEEDLDIRSSVDRLFLLLLSESSLADRDREYVAYNNLSSSRFSDFIKYHVFSEQNAEDVASNLRSRLIADPWALSAAKDDSLAILGSGGISSLRSLLDSPTLQSFGQAILNEFKANSESAIKEFVVSKVESLGFSGADAMVMTDRAWSAATSLIVGEADVSDIANDFLVTLVGGIESGEVQKAFKGLVEANVIDGLTGLPASSDDNIFGSDFNDAKRAGEGDDIVNLGAGDDLVRLGTGSDVVTLGEGKDTVLVTVDQLDGQIDTVLDWTVDDRLALETGIRYSFAGDNALLLSANVNDESRELTLALNGWNGDLNALNVISDL